MTEKEKPGCDLLIISPHTDDAEIGLGGAIALLARQGRSVWLADLTRGEMASNASVAERWLEAEAACAVLGVTGRIQLGLPDGFVSAHKRKQVEPVVDVIKRLRPRWIATAPDAVRHPDHVETPQLVRKAAFLARLSSLDTDSRLANSWPADLDLPAAAPSWSPEAVFRTAADDEQPSVLLDVSADWETKLASLRCYRSQFVRGEGRQPTMINSDAFLEKIERRARTWGRRAGVRYAEALCTDAAPVFDDLPDARWSS